VVEIIMASPAVEMNRGDNEVELDFNTLDTRTLRQLQAYVAQCLNPVKYRSRTSAGGRPGPVSQPATSQHRTVSLESHHLSSASLPFPQTGSRTSHRAPSPMAAAPKSPFDSVRAAASMFPEIVVGRFTILLCPAVMPEDTVRACVPEKLSGECEAL
jgi:hypothetical protein